MALQQELIRIVRIILKRNREMEKEIIIVKPKTLSSKDKEKLTKSGKIVIEHEKASEFVVLKNTESGDYYEHINCYKCGERIYLLHERLDALKKSKTTFYCSQGHNQAFN